MIEKLRSEIDKIDAKLLFLLNKRFKLSKLTYKYKKEIKDTKREKEIINKISLNIKKYKYLDIFFIKSLYKIIFNKSRDIQD